MAPHPGRPMIAPVACSMIARVLTMFSGVGDVGAGGGLGGVDQPGGVEVLRRHRNGRVVVGHPPVGWSPSSAARTRRRSESLRPSSSSTDWPHQRQEVRAPHGIPLGGVSGAPTSGAASAVRRPSYGGGVIVGGGCRCLPSTDPPDWRRGLQRRLLGCVRRVVCLGHRGGNPPSGTDVVPVLRRPGANRRSGLHAGSRGRSPPRTLIPAAR